MMREMLTPAADGVSNCTEFNSRGTVVRRRELPATVKDAVVEISCGWVGQPGRNLGNFVVQSASTARWTDWRSSKGQHVTMH